MTYGAFSPASGDRLRTLFLETSANTYSSLLGPIQSPPSVLISQIFNSLGVISGVLIGQLMVFGENDPSHEQLLAMPPLQTLHAIRWLVRWSGPI